MVFTTPPFGAPGEVYLLPPFLPKKVPDIHCRQILGRGASAEVALLTSLKERSFTLGSGRINFPFVVKRYFSPRHREQGDEEWRIQVILRGPFVPEHYFHYVLDDRVYLGMECVGPQNIEQQHLLSETFLPRDDFVAFCYLSVRIVEFFARKGWTHSDIKPANMVFWQDGKIHEENLEGGENLSDKMKGILRSYRCKIFDFGLSCPEGVSVDGSEVQTACYRSARRILGERITWKNECPSVGATLWEIYCKKRLFPYPERVWGLVDHSKKGKEFERRASLLQLHYTWGFTKTPSRPTLARFCQQHRENILQYYRLIPEGTGFGVTLQKTDYTDITIASSRGKRKKRYSYEEFYRDMENFEQEKKGELKAAMTARGDTEEFASRLFSLVHTFVQADRPLKSFAEIFAHDFFTALWE